MRTLAEEYFVEIAGFKTAGAIGRGIGANFSPAAKLARDRMIKSGAKGFSQTMNFAKNDSKTTDLLKAAGNSTSGVVGNVAGQAALGGVYVGAAYLAYKGLMKLKDRFSKSQNPQEKQNLQKQIDQGQSKLQRAKELNKVKQKQESDKRQREAKG